MSATLDLARSYGLVAALAVVVSGALVARGLLVPIRAVARRVVERWRLRAARRRLGTPVAVAFTVDDDGRPVTLDGTFVAEGARLRVGAVLVELGAADDVDARDGERALARGTLRRGVDQAGAMFRDAAPPTWSLEPSGGRPEIARVAPYRPSRASAVAALVLGGFVGELSLYVAGEHALTRLLPAQRALTWVTPSRFTWELRRDPRNGGPLSVALCSPWHRRNALDELRGERRTESFLAADEATVRKFADGLVEGGRPLEAAELYFAAGLLDRSAEAALASQGPRARELVLEARYGAGWVHGYPFGRNDAYQWLARRPLDVRGPEILWLATMLGREGVADDEPLLAEGGPHDEALRCVVRALQDSDFAYRRRALAPSSVEDMLRSPSPACRIIGATRRGRRDASGLRALNEVAPRAHPAWRPLLDAARDVIVLEGARAGRPPVGPPCAGQEPYGEIDPDRYARMPAVAMQLIHASHGSSCLWMADRVRLPAQEAVLRYLRDAYSEPQWRRLCLPRETPGHSECLDFVTGWYVYVLQGYRAALASRRDSASLDPRFDDRWEASLREGLRRVRRDGAVMAARATLGGASTSSLAETLARLAARGPGIEPTWNSDGVGADLEAHAGELPAPLAEAVRLGRALTPAARVRVLLEAGEGHGLDVPRARALAAARGGDTLALLSVLGPPTADAVGIFADVAPLLTTHRAAARPWLRVAASYTRPGAMSLAERERLVAALGRARDELAPDMGNETTLSFASPTWLSDDLFVWAVVEAMREEARATTPR